MDESPAPSAAPAAVPTPAAVTKEELLVAAGRDDAAVEALLRSERESRDGQIERLRTALRILKGELADEQRDERSRVARVARGLLDEHLVAVRAELSSSTDAQLKELEERITNARAVAVETERASTDPFSVESVNLEIGEVTRELREGDWKTHAKYAAAAAAAGIAAKWLWDHSVGLLWEKAAGTEEKPGFMRRAAGWFVAAGAAALGVLGLSRFSALSNTVLKTVIESAKNVGDGAREGWEASAAPTIEAISKIISDGRTAEVRRRFHAGEFATEEEYHRALAQALMLDGVEIVWESGVMHFARAGATLVLDDLRLGMALTEFAVNQDSESGNKALKIYVKGAVVYATSFGAVQGLLRTAQTRSLTAGMRTVVTESALWPVQVLRKANDARYILLTTGGRTYLRSVAGQPGYYWNRLLHGSRLRGGTTAAAQQLIDEWRAWDELRVTARLTRDTEFIAGLEAKCAAIEQNLARTAAALRQQPAAALVDASAEVRQLVSAGDLRGISAWLRSSPPPPPGSVAAPGAASLPTGVPSAPASAAGGAADASADVSTGLPRAPGSAVDTPADVLRAQEQLTRAVDSESVAAVLRQSGSIDPNLARALNESDDFTRSLGAYLRTADDPAAALAQLNRTAAALDDPTVLARVATTEGRMTQVMRGAAEGGDMVSAMSKTSRVVKALTVAGMVGDAFTIYVTVCEMQETQRKIEAFDASGRDNPELRNLYVQEYAFHAAQLGIAGTGLVTGGMVLAGVGTSVAGPVALATIPLSALVYAGYQGHKWEEAKARTAEDWAQDYDLPTLIHDMRHFDWTTEGVQYAWDLGYDNYRWLTGPWFTNPREEARQFIADLQDMNEDKVRATVRQTTTVTVPEQVEGEDGKPRALTAEEVQRYVDAGKAYADAKVRSILDRARSLETPISSGEDVMKLMMDAEDAGSMAYAESLLKAQGQTLPPDWPAETESPEKRIQQFRALRERQTMETLYTSSLLMTIMGKSSEEDVAAMLELNLGQYLLRQAQPAIVRFLVECQEENFQEWWPDGNAMEVLKAYLLDGLTPILRTQSSAIAAATLEDIRRDTGGDDSTPHRQPSVDALVQRVHDAERLVQEHFLGQRPRQLWDAMPDDARARHNSAVGAPPSGYYRERPHADIIPEGEEAARPIEELLSQPSNDVRVAGTTFYIRNAAGYSFIRITEGTIGTGSELQSPVVSVGSNDPFPLEVGSYRVFRPGESLQPQEWEGAPGTKRTLNFQRSFSNPEEANKWKELVLQRFRAGQQALGECGATPLARHPNAFWFRTSYFHNALVFYFDSPTGTWRANLADWMMFTDEHLLWRSAVGGTDVTTFHWDSLGESTDAPYLAVLAKLRETNDRQDGERG